MIFNHNNKKNTLKSNFPSIIHNLAWNILHVNYIVWTEKSETQKNFEMKPW